MAKAYLGKISALVTANTSDFNSKLNASAKEVRSFASSMQSTLRRAEDDSSKSLRSIYTEAQKVERALRAAGTMRLSFKGFDSRNTATLEQAAAAMQRMVSATELINKPLSAAAKSVQSLSAGVQGQFLPALVLAQRGAEAVNAAINRSGDIGERSFARVENQVNETIIAIDRLREAAAGISSLPTGNELRFVNPALVEQQQRAAAAQQQVAALPPRQAAGFRDLVASQRAAAERSLEANARLEAARLQQRRNPFRAPGDVAAAEQNLRSVLAAERQITEEIENQIALSQRRAAADAERANAQNRFFRAEADRRSGAAAQRNAASFDAATESVMRAPQRDAEVLIGRRERTVDSVRAEIRQLDQELQRLPQAAQDALQGDAERLNSIAEAARNGSAGLGTLIDQYERVAAAVRAAASEEERRQSSLRDANSRLNVLQDESAQLSQRGAIGGPQGPPLPPGFGGRSDAGLGPAINDPQRQLDGLRSSIVSVKGQIDQLPAGLRQQFIPAITAAEAEFRRLAAAPNQSAVAIDVARQRLIALTREANQASQALDFRRSFGSRDAIVSSLQTQQLRGYTAQIQILEGELASVTGFARGPAVAAIARLGTVISEQMRRGTIDTQAARQEVQRLIQDAVRATAAASGISAGALGRTVARAGDVGRKGFANIGLGIQQATFAFEDFFSVTGGLDQRIRAAGNNISQLGFVLGSTEGLVAGVAIAVGAQLVASIIKWTGVTEDAERRQRELKDALESTNGALERQRQLAEQLRNTYRELAKSIAEAGAPEAFRDERQRRDQIAAVQREQEDRRRAGIEANSPQIAQQRGRIAEIDRQLETEQNAATRQRLIERRNAADAAIRREIDDVERRAAQNARVAIERNAGIDGALRDQQGRRDALRGDIGTAARRGNEAEVNRLSRELSVIETTILRLRDASVRLGAERGQDIIGGINRTQANIENVPGIRQLDVFSSVVRTEYERFSNLLKDGQITFQEFNNAQQRLAAVGERAERASAQLGVFADALQSAAGSLARAVEQELRGRVDSQRREANAAEARFGTDDPRAQLARRQQQQSEEIARRGTRDRESIDAEISRQRRNFESAALDGGGGAEANRIGERLREIGQALSRQPENRAEANQQERLRLEADVLRRQLGELFNATPGAQQLNRQADLADIRGQQGIQGQEAVRRGFEASITPAQRAGEELARTLADLKAAQQDGAVSLEQYNAAVKRVTDEQLRSIAPAVASLADEVQNALAQGPSRAALQATDSSTLEGQRELNRLLRGEDANRNVDLAELQRQANALLEAIAKNTEDGAPVAN